MASVFIDKVGVLWGLSGESAGRSKTRGRDYDREYAEEKEDEGKRLEVVRIADYERMPRILELMSLGSPLIVSLDVEIPKRKLALTDFIFGIVYAYDGSIEKVRDGIYVLMPQGTSVNDDSIWYALYR